MGLLSVPKKYNPPGNGKRDMEYPIYATKAEQGLLKRRGGAGKMTKHGLLSFGLGDKGNEVGSAGGSHAAGDGKGGQIDTRSFGMGTDGVLGSIGGKWTVVSRSSGTSIGGGSKAPATVKVTPVAAPPNPTAIALPSIPASALAAQYGMYKNPTAGMPATAPASAVNDSSYFGDVSSYRGSAPSPATNPTPPLGMGGTRGSYSAPAARTGITSMFSEAQRRTAASRLSEQYSKYRSPPGSSPITMDPSIRGRNDAAISSELRSAGVPGGGGVVAYEGGPAAGVPSAAPDPRFRVGVMDAPRLAADPTTGIGAYPGAGVPDLPTTRVAKEFYDRIAPSSVKAITDRLPTDMTAPVGSRIGSPAPGYTYAEQRPKMGLPFDTPAYSRFSPPSSEVAADVWSRIGKLIDAKSRPAESEVGTPAGLGPTFGPETPTGPEGWQQGTSIDPTSSTLRDFATEILKDTPAARATRGIIKVLDVISGGPEYRSDVSLGTDESGMRTDRAPSGGGFNLGPGSFGPGGQDRGWDRMGANTGGPGHAPSTPPPIPPIVPPVNPAAPQWYFPQYTQAWANLPTGLGGPIWRPSAPTGGIFDEDHYSKKKQAAGGRRNA